MTTATWSTWSPTECWCILTRDKRTLAAQTPSGFHATTNNGRSFHETPTDRTRAPSLRRNYTKGNYFTVEWGVVKNLDPHITLGLVGYNTWQVSGDSGPAVGQLFNPVRDFQHAIGGELTFTIPEANYLCIGIKHLRDVSTFGRLSVNTTALSISVPIDTELPAAPLPPETPVQPENPAPASTPQPSP